MLLRDAIYVALRRSILNCEFQPGQEIRELVLAERYKVSRSPVRDSLLRLEQENLVTVMPRHGCRVNPISTSDIEEVFSLRLLIEPTCVAAAAARDDQTLKPLLHFGAFSGEYKAFPGCVEYDETFHCTIAGFSPNKRMATIAVGLIEQSGRLFRLALPTCSHDAIDRHFAEHAAIIEAIQARDADRASRLSYEHIINTYNQIDVARIPPEQRAEPRFTAAEVAHDNN